MATCTLCSKTFDIINVDVNNGGGDENSIYCGECVYKHFYFDMGKKDYVSRADLFKYGVYQKFYRTPINELIDEEIDDDDNDQYKDEDEGMKFYMCCICQSKFKRILISDCNHKYCNDCLKTMYHTHVKDDTNFTCAMCRKVYIEDEVNYEKFKVANFMPRRIDRLSNKKILKRRLRVFENLRRHKFTSHLTKHKSKYYREIPSREDEAYADRLLNKVMNRKLFELALRGISRPMPKSSWFGRKFANILTTKEYHLRIPLAVADYRVVALKGQRQRRMDYNDFYNYHYPEALQFI